MFRLFVLLIVLQASQSHGHSIIKGSLSRPSSSASGSTNFVQPESGSSQSMASGLEDLQINSANGDVSISASSTGAIVQLPPGGNSNIVRGLQCGSKVQMYPGNSAQVFSTNFRVAHYYNNEACTWRFQANQCTLSAYCPCVDIPKSWECLGDYLKISTDYILEKQRFCGGNKPEQPIYSDTDFLNIRFRSDSKITAAGFTCFVRCEGPGQRMPMPPSFECPTSASLRE